MPLPEESQKVIVGRGEGKWSTPYYTEGESEAICQGTCWGTRFVQSQDPMRHQAQHSLLISTTQVSACLFYTKAQLRRAPF